MSCSRIVVTVRVLRWDPRWVSDGPRCQQRSNVRAGSRWQATGGTRSGHLVWVLGLLVGWSSGAYPMRIVVTLAKVAVKPPVTGHFTGRLKRDDPSECALEGRVSDVYARWWFRMRDGLAAHPPSGPPA